ncbi:hypothetical protein D3C87_1814030 [compost metagenome]
MPLPGLLAQPAVAPLTEAGAVFAKLRLGLAVEPALGIIVRAKPPQALGVIDVQVPHRTVEPEQIQPGFGHGQGRALNSQVQAPQVAVDLFVGQLQIGAELMALAAP